MLTRDQLHRLIDALSEEQVAAASTILEKMTDPLIRALAAAPEDDEPLTSEDVKALREADEAIARGEILLHEEMRRRHNL